MMITNDEKLACIEREIRYRERVYPKRVAAGQMTQSFAAEQILLMQAIAEDYRRLIEKERLL